MLQQKERHELRHIRITVTKFIHFLFIRRVQQQLRKASINFVTSVSPSVCTSATWLPLDGFTRNLVLEGFFFYFENLSRKFKFLLQSDENERCSTRRQTDIQFVSHLAHLFLEWPNISDKSFRENKKTHFVFSIFFFLNRANSGSISVTKHNCNCMLDDGIYCKSE